MHPNPKWALLIAALLAATVVIAGCSGGGNGGNTTPAAPGTVVKTTAGPLYSAGDVVRNPKTSSTTALLIIGYDPSTDMYERALLYPNADGSWGYRVNSETVKAPRSVVESIYSERVTTLSVSAVPIGTPAPATTITTAATSVSGAATALATVTPTAAPPVIYDIRPDTGMVGTSVSITDLHGANFVTGAAVTLTRDGSTTITATNVVVTSPTSITCTLPIPAEATPGSWNVVVQNPDSQVASYSNIFEIHYNPSATTTTSAGVTSGGITITNIDPSSVGGANMWSFTISGTNFLDGIAASLQKTGSTDIPASYCLRSTTSQMMCRFNIPMGSNGQWTLYLKNTDGTSGSLTNGLTVNG
ncbi:MAG TPA: IPT/TIG domain-containing protein [Methanoregula sp.]|nr:IPT/TIG domain-containing protein [Methanoregula sp.]